MTIGSVAPGAYRSASSPSTSEDASTWTFCRDLSRTKADSPVVQTSPWQMFTESLRTAVPGAEIESKASSSESMSETG